MLSIVADLKQFMSYFLLIHTRICIDSIFNIASIYNERGEVPCCYKLPHCFIRWIRFLVVISFPLVSHGFQVKCSEVLSVVSDDKSLCFGPSVEGSMCGTHDVAIALNHTGHSQQISWSPWNKWKISWYFDSWFKYTLRRWSLIIFQLKEEYSIRVIVFNFRCSLGFTGVLLQEWSVTVRSLNPWLHLSIKTIQPGAEIPMIKIDGCDSVWLYNGCFKTNKTTSLYQNEAQLTYIFENDLVLHTSCNCIMQISTQSSPKEFMASWKLIP